MVNWQKFRPGSRSINIIGCFTFNDYYLIVYTIKGTTATKHLLTNKKYWFGDYMDDDGTIRMSSTAYIPTIGDKAIIGSIIRGFAKTQLNPSTT